MAESFFELSRADRVEALEVAAARSGRPPDLLEKDVWVVWVLDVLFRAPFGEQLTFKGGTSLSKAFGVIDRFSEDVDLTYDIRALLPDLANEEGDPIPASRSAADRLTGRVREALPAWVARAPLAGLEGAVETAGIDEVAVRLDGDRLVLAYPPSVKPAVDYVRSEVLIEFGARSAGVPSDVRAITCDAAPHLPEVRFPTADPRVLRVERTFWEKATAAHVYCLQKRLRGDRFARHWYDLARLEVVGLASVALADREVAEAVADHKPTLLPRERCAGRGRRLPGRGERRSRSGTAGSGTSQAGGRLRPHAIGRPPAERCAVLR
ncbi:MAG: nucleotidyl transferase AbiEii/AbiGii toxin family protein [Longimicrobiales bacterium]